MKTVAVPYQTFASIGYAIRKHGGGRISVPVAPSQYIYSHFKHISGVPAPEGVGGVSINKLKVIDMLMEQLERLDRAAKTEAQSKPPLAEEDSGFAAVAAKTDSKSDTPESDDSRVNNLIGRYSQLRAQTFRTEADARTASRFGRANPFAPAAPGTGLIFGIAA
jgi:hypothetical protein